MASLFRFAPDLSEEILEDTIEDMLKDIIENGRGEWLAEYLTYDHLEDRYPSEDLYLALVAAAERGGVEACKKVVDRELTIAMFHTGYLQLICTVACPVFLETLLSQTSSKYDLSDAVLSAAEASLKAGQRANFVVLMKYLLGKHDRDDLTAKLGREHPLVAKTMKMCDHPCIKALPKIPGASAHAKK